MFLMFSMLLEELDEFANIQEFSVLKGIHLYLGVLAESYGKVKTFFHEALLLQREDWLL